MLEMLERLGALEPGIQHLVGGIEIGNEAAAKDATSVNDMISPGAFSDHGMVL